MRTIFDCWLFGINDSFAIVFLIIRTCLYSSHLHLRGLFDHFFATLVYTASDLSFLTEHPFQACLEGQLDLHCVVDVYPDYSFWLISRLLILGKLRQPICSEVDTFVCYFLPLPFRSSI